MAEWMDFKSPRWVQGLITAVTLFLVRLKKQTLSASPVVGGQGFQAASQVKEIKLQYCYLHNTMHNHDVNSFRVHSANLRHEKLLQ